jgi:hypothetical protein
MAARGDNPFDMQIKLLMIGDSGTKILSISPFVWEVGVTIFCRSRDRDFCRCGQDLSFAEIRKRFILANVYYHYRN